MSDQFGRNIHAWSPPRIPADAALRLISWSALPLGAVIIDGVRIDGVMPEELRAYPVVDASLRRRLFERYHFRSDHPVTIAGFSSPDAACERAVEIRSLAERIRAGAPLRADVAVERRFWDLGTGDTPGFESPRLTESSRLVKDVYNSFTVSTSRPGPIPTLLGDGPASDISFAQIVSGLLSGRRLFPLDLPLVLHCALDVSFSMKDRDRIRHGIAVVNRLAAQVPAVMPGTQVRAYAFSDDTRELRTPVETIPLRSEGTKQAPVMQRVIRNADPATRNLLVLVSDGEPQDLPATLRTAEKLKTAGVDYLQILLHTDDDLRHQVVGARGEFEIRDDTVSESDVPAERIIALDSDALKKRVDARFDDFTRVAETAGGSQVVLTEFTALGLVTVELYDRYVGLLSLAGEGTL